MFEKKVVFSASLLDFHVDVNVSVISEIHLLSTRLCRNPADTSRSPSSPRTLHPSFAHFFFFLPYNCDCHNHHQQSSSRLLPASSCLSSAGRDAQMMTLSMTPLEREWHQSAKTTEMQFRVEKKQPLSTWGEYHVFD